MSELSSHPHPTQVVGPGVGAGESDLREHLELMERLAPSDSGQDVDADPDSTPDPAGMPAEIVVLLDSEDNPSLPRRSRPRGLRPLELPGQSWGASEAELGEGEHKSVLGERGKAAGQVASAALRSWGSGMSP